MSSTCFEGFIYIYANFWLITDLLMLQMHAFGTDVIEPLLIEFDQIYHLACPASPIFYTYNPVKVCIMHFHTKWLFPDWLSVFWSSDLVPQLCTAI